MKVQPYVIYEGGETFDITFNDGSVSFRIIDFTKEEVFELLESVKTQIEMLEKVYFRHLKQKEEPE